MTTPFGKKHTIKIVSFKNPLLWYATHVGKTFEICRTDSRERIYWVRETEFPFALNWVHWNDAELL